MNCSPNARPSRPRGKIVWKAIDPPEQIRTSTSVAGLYRRIKIRNELLRNIEASLRSTSGNR